MSPETSVTETTHDYYVWMTQEGRVLGRSNRQSFAEETAERYSHEDVLPEGPVPTQVVRGSDGQVVARYPNEATTTA